MYLRSISASIRPGVLLLVAVFGISIPGMASGQEFCSEPVMPYCVDQYSDFDSTLQMDRCEEDLKAQKKKLADYRACTTRKIKDIRNELKDALSKLEQVRTDFEQN